jgi:hypothetical protein
MKNLVAGQRIEDTLMNSDVIAILQVARELREKYLRWHGGIHRCEDSRIATCCACGTEVGFRV